MSAFSNPIQSADYWAKAKGTPDHPIHPFIQSTELNQPYRPDDVEVEDGTVSPPNSQKGPNRGLKAKGLNRREAFIPFPSSFLHTPIFYSFILWPLLFDFCFADFHWLKFMSPYPFPLTP
jgi:hypothetical protein